MTGALCRIRHKADQPLPKIDITYNTMLRCLIPGIKEEQKLTGTIKNLVSDTAEARIGVEFSNLQSHLADTIGNYLFALARVAE